MSLFSAMRTSVAGMAAQSNALSAVGDNIANASTTGYKKASTEFETMLGQSVTSDYISGGVQTDVRYGVTEQGTLTSTTSATDLAVSGNGFFVVSNGGQGTYMTRAGSFVPDSSGNLVNTAGYQLMGYKIAPDGSTSQLTTVNVSSSDLLAAASTNGTLTANLPSTATGIAAANLPSTNTAGAQYTDKTSITVYDNLGSPTVLDVYMTKTTDDSKWEVAAYPQADAAAGGGFPYKDATGTADTAAKTDLVFDKTTGKLSSGGPLTYNVPNGHAVAIDMGGMTQLATDFGVTTATANGNAPSRVDHVKIGTDGTLTEVYASGVQVATYKIPLATVASPDNLTPLSGNVYQVSTGSGDMILSTAGTNGAGLIKSDSLEQSTVDLATELTNMIQAQRGYEANSKVLQTSSDLLGVLNRLTTN